MSSVSSEDQGYQEGASDVICVVLEVILLFRP